MDLSATEVLRLPGLHLRHPADAEVRTSELRTRSYRVRRVQVRGPWMVSGDDPSLTGRYRIRIMIFEDPAGEPVGDLLAAGRVRPDPGSHALVEGEIGGRKAILREPVDRARTPRGAYVVGERRFFFLEWEGPADAVLDTLELEP